MVRGPAQNWMTLWVIAVALGVQALLGFSPFPILLSTVHGIVHQCEGRLELESEPGRGTLVRVLLPVVAGDLQPERPARAESARPLERSATVLLVEDDPLVRRHVLRTLEGAGHRVLVAHDGEAALETAGRCREPIDLLVSDLVMPRIGGTELADRLARQRPGLRVLFISGYAREEPAVGAALWGRAFLPKPFTPRGLLHAIEQVLATPDESHLGS